MGKCLSPLPALLRARAASSLGALNPLPLVAVTGNNAGQAAYSLTTTHDPFVLAATIPGVMLGLFYVYTAFRVARPEQRPLIACAAGLYTLALGGASLLSFTPSCPCTAESAFGLLAMSLPIMFYASPVPAMADAIRRRSA